MEHEPSVFPERKGPHLSPRQSAARSNALLVGALVALGVVGSLLALALGTDYLTASPRLCGSCHEMVPRTAAWRQSGHAEIRCVSCHEPPHAWYALPQSLIARGKLLGRDVHRHLTHQYDDPVDRRLPGAAPMSNAICLQCHTANRRVTSGDKVVIKHAEHAKANKSCVSCHLRTAHPEPIRGRSLSFMAQCFVCHGTAKYPKASATCDACHPEHFDLRPASHKGTKWTYRHGRVSASDRQQCAMCHVESSCRNCHGLEMPHPQGWTRGESGHAAFAKKNRRVCARCHTEKPDLCGMCHHTTYDPKKGPWVEQHPIEVIDRGVAYCFRCHGPLFCNDCHVGNNAP